MNDLDKKKKLQWESNLNFESQDNRTERALCLKQRTKQYTLSLNLSLSVALKSSFSLPWFPKFLNRINNNSMT